MNTLISNFRTEEIRSVKNEVSRTRAEKPLFEAAVGLSREWNARKAGREVAEDTLKKLGKDPDFFLLFSTIHYEKYGGFKEFIKGVWEVLPEGTPLIGGTVSGFMNNQGCYTRGATALAVSYQNMNIATGVGRDTKRSPARAAKDCAKMIRKGLDSSKYEHGFIIDAISGGLSFQIPFVGRRRVFQDIPGMLANLTTSITSSLFSKGPGREEEVLEKLKDCLEDFCIMSGSSMDDNQFISNYQFYNKEVLENSIVCLGIKTDLGFDIIRDHGLSQTKKELKITKISSDRRFIYEINGKPAVQELLRLMEWPNEYITEKLLHDRTLYYPLGFNHNGEMAIDVIALVSGNSLCMVHQVKEDTLYVLSASGRELASAVDTCIQPFKERRPLFGFIYSCGIRLDTLGSSIFRTQERLSEYFKGVPFLATYVTGEGVYKPESSLQYGNDTFNMSVFWENTTKDKKK